MRKLIFILTSIVLLAVACERKVLLEPGHHHGNEIRLEIDLDALLDEEVQTGDNPDMSRAQGVNVNLNKVIGLAISNGIVALAGALLAQYKGSANINDGRGARRAASPCCRGHASRWRRVGDL